MKMYFHFDIGIDYLLFAFWKPDSACQTFFSCLAICTFGVAYEALKYAQKVVYVKQTEKETYGQMNYKANLADKFQLLQVVLYIAQNFLLYSSMLIAMTFQVYFLIAIITGAALGYFFFEPLRAQKHVVSISSRYTAI